MKNIKSIFAVSLIAVMAAGAARADIASVELVNDKLAGKQDTLTAGQLAAANSGITSAKVTTYDGYNASITKNTNDITTLNGADTVAGSVANKIKSATSNMQVTTNMATAASVSGTGADKGSTTKYTSVAAAEKIAETAANAVDSKVTSLTTRVTNAEGKITAAETDIDSLQATGVTKAKIDQITTNQNNIDTLQSGKQDKLTSTNIVGAGNVAVNVAADGKITVTGTQYNDTAIKKDIADIKTEQETQNSAITAAQAKADAAMPTTTYNTATTVAADSTYVKKANNVATNLTALDTGLKNVATTANAALPKNTYDTQVGTVNATNMGTTATTVVAAIKEVAGEASDAQAAADAADDKAVAAAAAAAAAKTAAETADAKAVAAQNTADKAVVANTAITAGTGTKITYDAKGLVTGSSALAKSDIPTIDQSQVNGLTADLAAKIPVPKSDTSVSTGVLVLTYNPTTKAYAWENIGR